MKASTSILALMGLFTIAFGAAIPGDDTAAAIEGTSDNVNIKATPCQTYSRIYKDRKNHCLKTGPICESECKKLACTSIVNGRDCSSMCL